MYIEHKPGFMQFTKWERNLAAVPKRCRLSRKIICLYLGHSFVQKRVFCKWLISNLYLICWIILDEKLAQAPGTITLCIKLPAFALQLDLSRLLMHIRYYWHGRWMNQFSKILLLRYSYCKFSYVCRHWKLGPAEICSFRILCFWPPFDSHHWNSLYFLLARHCFVGALFALHFQNA